MEGRATSGENAESVLVIMLRMLNKKKLLRISILISLIVALVKTEPAESKTFVIVEPADRKFESLHCL